VNHDDHFFLAQREIFNLPRRQQIESDEQSGYPMQHPGNGIVQLSVGFSHESFVSANRH
jgi:hypothetical protein